MGGSVDSDHVPEEEQVVHDAGQVAGGGFHRMVVPVIGHSESHIESMVLPQELSHLHPQTAVTLLTASGSLFAASYPAFASAAAHSSDRYLHSHNNEHDVKHRSLAEPKR